MEESPILYKTKFYEIAESERKRKANAQRGLAGLASGGGNGTETNFLLRTHNDRANLSMNYIRF